VQTAAFFAVGPLKEEIEKQIAPKDAKREEEGCGHIVHSTAEMAVAQAETRVATRGKENPERIVRNSLEHGVRGGTRMISRRTGVWILIGFTVIVCAAAMLFPRTAQPESYHEFADRRPWLGIANFGDVASNVAFAVAGAWGLVFLSTGPGVRSFEDARERWAYFAVFLGLLLTAFGSSYYHLAPDNARLVWDRLPMAVAFMGLVSAMIAERISVPAGVCLLPLLLVVGVGSVLWWWHTETIGAGDLRFYAAVQVYAVLVLPVLLLLPPRYTRGADFLVIFGFYVLAKVFETEDRRIFGLTGRVVSGHTLKHLAAGAAGFWILRMLARRRPIEGA
jgi:hypothetical protein